MSYVCTRESADRLLCNGTVYVPYEEPLSYRDTMFWVYLSIYVALVLLAGLMSGLTMGLLSLDILSLRVLQRGGKPSEKKHAGKILPLVEKHHLLLVTLLLANAAAVESMPIFMDRISSPVIAICVSVTAVLFFGDIYTIVGLIYSGFESCYPMLLFMLSIDRVVPQALCTRYGLAIGSVMAPFVRVLIVILFVVAWPISKLLDCLLGHEHSTFFRRAELRELVDLHREYTGANEEPLRDDEVMIIQGALEMRNKTVQDRYTPLEQVFMLDSNRKLDHDTMKEISRKGHSRVPVYEGERGNIVGLLLVKALIVLDPEDATPIKEVYQEGSLLKSSSTEPLFELLDKFQTGKSHLCVVYKTQIEEGNQMKSRVVGIITLEDVLELLIQEEIWDEADVTRYRHDVQRQVSLAKAKLRRMKSIDERGHGPLSPTPEEATPKASETTSDTQPLLGPHSF